MKPSNLNGPLWTSVKMAIEAREKKQAEIAIYYWNWFDKLAVFNTSFAEKLWALGELDND